MIEKPGCEPPNEPRQSRRIVVFVAGCLLAAASVSTVITPIAWRYSNAFTTARKPDNLSDTNGMNGDQTILYNVDGSLPGELPSADNVA